MKLREAESLAKDLMRQHGVGDWHFHFSNAKWLFGYCDYGLRTIKLSKILTRLNDYDEVQNTILHEIAHALAGPNTGHGAKWKQIARQIGCDGNGCYDSKIVTTPKAPYERYCDKCGNSRPIFRLSRKKARACGRCCREHNSGYYSDVYLLKVRKNKT